MTVAERLRRTHPHNVKATHPNAIALSALREPDWIIDTAIGKRQWLIYGEVVASTGPYGTSVFKFDETNGIGDAWVHWGADRLHGWPWNWFRDPVKQVFAIVDRMNTHD